MIGSRLRRVRLERELTLRDVAAAVGITERALAKIEKNESVPGGDTWEKLADFFGMKMDDFREPKAAAPADPVQLQNKLTDAAHRSQVGATKVERQAALAEMRQLYSLLANAEAERVDTERSSEASSSTKSRTRKK